jgi:hypothetical protein
MVRFLLLAALLAVLAEPASGQAPAEPATLRVRVVDANTNVPIPGARVGLTDIGFFALTDTSGVATLRGIPPGQHAFEAVMFGFASETAVLDLGPGAVAVGDVALTFAPIAIDEIMVEGRSRWSAHLQRKGFYKRAEEGIGYHLDRPAIRDLNVLVLSEVLDKLPVRPGFAGFVDPVPTADDVDYAMELPAGCAPGIYVDGTPWVGFIDDMPLFWVEGLEYYASPTQVPIQFQGYGAFCGLVLIWTG